MYTAYVHVHVHVDTVAGSPRLYAEWNYMYSVAY